MKKTVAKMLCASILAVLMLGLLVGCNSDIFLKELNVRQFGDLLVWKSADKASTYEVYQNGELLESTVNTYYRVPENKEEQTYTVRAKNDKGENASKLSNEVKVARTVFSKQDILKVDLSTQSGSIIVKDDIKQVQVSGSSNNACLVIENRSDDLFITLKGVQMTAPAAMSCIGYGEMPEGHTPQFTTCIELDGNCSLRAGAITYVPPQPASGSGISGTAGTPGVASINLAKMVIYGEGDLKAYGGVGGVGGKGANSKGTHMQAAGARGGQGGAGIACSECYIMLTGEITTVGGAGGEGGTYGSGNASAGGLLGSLFVTPDNYYAANGYDGAKVTGSFNVLAGVVDWN